jgi:indole-3-glycerol phosphate synthase
MNDARRPPDILARIVAAERGVVARSREERPLAELRRDPRYPAPRRSLARALRAARPAVIAECKRRSPSRGLLRDPYDAVAIATSYEAAGAAGLSVLTNEEFFGGSLADLSAVRDATSIPVLRKDFVIDAYQIEEARAAGADAILLIAAVLSVGEMRTLAGAARDLGLETLVEVHDERELADSLDVGADVLGINNRDLRSFTTDLATTERLRPLLPADTLVVSESGLRDRRDLERLMAVGVGAFLVGEAFMSAPDPGRALGSLLASSSL